MMGRHLRTTLPVPSATLEPSWPDRETILARDGKYKLNSSKYHDQRHGAKPLQPLHPGNPVLVKTDEQKGWSEKGIVQGEADAPRSYNIETKSGMQRRNHVTQKTCHPQLYNQKLPKNQAVQIGLVNSILFSVHKQDISVQKPKQDISVQKSPVKPNSPVQEPRRSGRNIQKPERWIETV